MTEPWWYPPELDYDDELDDDDERWDLEDNPYYDSDDERLNSDTTELDVDWTEKSGANCMIGRPYDVFQEEVDKAYTKAKEPPLPDTGERMTYSTGMQREPDSEKVRYDLLFPEDAHQSQQMLYRWANHISLGAKKYSPRNWEKARTQEELDRFRQSAVRHFFQWMSGDTSEDHAAAVFFNIQGYEYTKPRVGWVSKSDAEEMITAWGDVKIDIIRQQQEGGQ